jgi:predicted HTH domain antitoxin
MVYAIEIPAEVVHATRMTLQEIKLELALMLFQQNKLSFGKAREMAGLTVWDFQLLLGQRKIPIHYDIQDYLADQPAIDALVKQ